MGTHNLCFGANIRKIGLPLHTPVFIYIKVGLRGINCTDMFSIWIVGIPFGAKIREREREREGERRKKPDGWNPLRKSCLGYIVTEVLF